MASGRCDGSGSKNFKADYSITLLGVHKMPGISFHCSNPSLPIPLRSQESRAEGGAVLSAACKSLYVHLN